MKFFKENWFALVIAIMTVITSISSMITSWLADGYLWSFFPAP